MALERTMATYAIADATLQSFLGSRIYCEGEVPQEVETPYCIYSQVSGSPLHSSQQAEVTTQARVQFEVIGFDFDQTREAAAQLRKFMHRYNWASASSISSVRMTNEYDDFAPPDDGSEVGTYRVVQDYSVWHGTY